MRQAVHLACFVPPQHIRPWHIVKIIGDNWDFGALSVRKVERICWWHAQFIIIQWRPLKIINIPLECWSLSFWPLIIVSLLQFSLLNAVYLSFFLIRHESLHIHTLNFSILPNPNGLLWNSSFIVYAQGGVAYALMAAWCMPTVTTARLYVRWFSVPLVPQCPSSMNTFLVINHLHLSHATSGK